MDLKIANIKKNKLYNWVIKTSYDRTNNIEYDVHTVRNASSF